MKTPRKPTFDLLAKAAKVSPATVSRLAAGQVNIDPEIRDRVRKEARRLGIDLEKKRDAASRVLAFVLANRDVLHSFQARVLIGAENYVSSHGWEMVFLTYRYGLGASAKELQLPQILNRRTPARGVIVAGVNSPAFLEALGQRNIPFAVLGNNVVGPATRLECDTVDSDDIGGARDITAHLIAQGHRHIWFIGDTSFPWFARCKEGYSSAMTGANLTPQVCEIRSEGRELGYLGTKSILANKQRVTAIFAGSDEVAHGAYVALREASLSVPEDISVVGFNDTSGDILHPALTSVREFPEELGRHLAEFTLKRLKDPSAPRQHLMIPTRLIARNSVAAPASK